MAGELRGAAADVDEQVEERGVGLHQREDLHAGREAGEEGVERGERRVGAGGAGHAADELGLEPAEDAAGALAAEGGEAAPGGHRRLGGGRVGEDGLGRRRVAGAGLGDEEGLGQGVDGFEPGGDLGFHLRQRLAAEVGEAGHLGGALGQALGLGVLEHLQPVLELAVGGVGLSERRGGLAVDPALVGERRQRRQRLALAQPRVAAADDELAGLGEELDVADAALAELEVVAGEAEGAGEALVGADAAADVLGVLDGGEVEVPAPDEGAEAGEEGLAGGDGAGAGAGLDVGGALPGAADALVVVLGRVGGDADRGDGGVGAEAEVDAEDVAGGGDLGEELHQALGDADEALAEVGEVVGVVAALVEEHDEVDVGGVVELARAHLAHGEDEHAGGLGDVRPR